MRMHIVANVATIQKFDDDFVADFGTEYRPQNSQPVRLWLASGESVVGVFDESSFGPPQFERPRLTDGRGVQQIDSAGGIVPNDVFSGDVVMTRRRERRATNEAERGKHQSPLNVHPAIIPFGGGRRESRIR